LISKIQSLTSHRYLQKKRLILLEKVDRMVDTKICLLITADKRVAKK
jgi:hypothetical protein